ncbi:hypothetical protein F5Y15DRAFT_419646 [Xylariaceae sp. FL0016]|nr:hypothetical protein F5Y15DRAFT_419646 [Xylariaceae sp. FL0016]
MSVDCVICGVSCTYRSFEEHCAYRHLGTSCYYPGSSFTQDAENDRAMSDELLRVNRQRCQEHGDPEGIHRCRWPHAGSGTFHDYSSRRSLCRHLQGAQRQEYARADPASAGDPRTAAQQPANPLVAAAVPAAAPVPASQGDSAPSNQNHPEYQRLLRALAAARETLRWIGEETDRLGQSTDGVAGNLSRMLEDSNNADIHEESIRAASESALEFTTELGAISYRTAEQVAEIERVLSDNRT